MRIFNLPAIAFDLCKSCYSRFDFMAAVIFFNLGFKDPIHRNGMGSWTDNGHITKQDVDKLGHFIQRSHSQKGTYSCDSWIIFDSLFGIGLVVWCHGPEFETDENLVVFAVPFLDKENRPLGLQLDQQAY